MIQRWDLRECFIYLSIFIFTPWASFQGFLLKFDAAARIPNTMIYISLLLVLWCYNKNLKKYLLPITFLGIWVTYTVINAAFQCDMVTGKWSAPFFAFLLYGKWAYFTVLLAMLNYRRFLVLNLLAWSLLASCLLYLRFGQINLHGADFERLFSDVVNANEIAFSGVALAAICVYLLLVPKPRWIVGLGGILLSITLISDTASRTAFVCIIPLLFIGFWNFLRKRLSLVSSLLAGALLVLVVAVPAWSYIEEKTVVGQRMQYREQEIQSLKIQEGIITDLLGERAIYYYEGLEIWERSPIFGVGYGNYLFQSRTGTRCHIEYMAQLSEGGIVGTFIYALFLLTLITAPLRYYFSDNAKLSLAEKTLSLGALLSVLMFNIGLFTAMHNDFYVLCACVLVVLVPLKNTSAVQVPQLPELSDTEQKFKEA